MNGLLKTDRRISFSLYYFGDYPAEYRGDKYHLCVEASRFGDRNGFAAIWIPERHFHSFGGFSPNPSVLAAALARETSTIRIQAGSVILPLHHPIRVAEEWSVVDNLSNGRVGIAFAAGWHPVDFVLAPQAWGNHRQLMFEGIETVRQLWRGEEIEVRTGTSDSARIRLYPLPQQTELPVWIASLGNVDTFIEAGRLGTGIVTNLIGQDTEDLRKKIILYRNSLSEHGYDPYSKTVTVLLHTFIGDDQEWVRKSAFQPFIKYLDSSVGLFQNAMTRQNTKVDFGRLTEDDRRFLLARAYDRYVENSALIGTPETCQPIVRQLIDIGVDDIACFIDFGIEADIVLANLPHLARLKKLFEAPSNPKVDKTQWVLAPQSRLDVISSQGKARASAEFAAGLPDVGNTNGISFHGESAQCEHGVRQIEKVPTTESQKLLWFLAQMGESGSIAYNLSTVLTLRGNLKFNLLRIAAMALVNRHEALRTSISTDGATQNIAKSVHVDVSLTDLSGLRLSERDSQFDKLSSLEAHKPFDLTHAPLLRLHIVHLAARLNIVLVTAHHIVCDGWSKYIVLEELGELYSSLSRQTPTSLTPTLQFRDYIKWHDQLSRSTDGMAHEEFWLRESERFPASLNLPTDKQHPPLLSFVGASEIYQLNSTRTQALKRFALDHRCTPFAALLAVYMALVHRLTGQHEIVIGVPTGGRTMKGSERVVGFCSNILPIRGRITPQTTIAEHLINTRDRLLDAFAHADYPFARLIEKLKIRRDASRSPLISAVFNWDHRRVPRFDDLESDSAPYPTSFSRFDMSLDVAEQNDYLTLSWNFNASIFRDRTIRQIVSHFETLLDDVLANPQSRVVDLKLLSPAHRAKIIHCAGESLLENSEHRLDKRFESQVRLTPDAVAAVDETCQITYMTLHTRAMQLAQKLRAEKIEPNEVVGVCLDRSIAFVVAILGILEAGAAYVPIDPAAKDERTQSIMRDVGARILVTQSDKQGNELALVSLDSRQGVSRGHSKSEHPRTGDPRDLAYVIYTSGSTGKPKGVQLEHRQLLNYLDGMTEVLRLPANAKYLMLTSVDVDLGNTVLLFSLCQGGCLHLVSRETAADPDLLAAYCSRNNVDCLKITPSYFEALLSSRNAHAIVPNSYLIFGGEVLTWNLVKRVKEINHFCRILNHYGPTETAIGVATSLAVEGDENSLTDNVPIGRPLRNCRLFVVDEYGHLCPIGMTGELYIGGANVSRGYYAQPELTAEFFVPDPYSGAYGERLYRTGDQVRLLQSRQFHFLGRKDQQLKIRGRRVELLEVESAIRSYPEVRDAAITTTTGPDPATKLIALIIADDRSTFMPKLLRDFLRARLPDYMVPTAFFFVDEIPRTGSGKVDRRLLLCPEQFEAPVNWGNATATQEEQEIANVFKTLLGVSQVGMHESFFDLGGHSLIAMHAVTQLRQVLGIELPLRTFFELPTVAMLANYFVAARSVAQEVKFSQETSSNAVDVFEL